MQMQKWLVSTVLGLTLVGGAGCGPQEQPAPTPAPETTQPQQPAPQQEDEGRTVSAMAATVITWEDFTRAHTTTSLTCISARYAHSCAFCASNNDYQLEYSNSSCTGPNDTFNSCITCDKVWLTDIQPIYLPDGDLINVIVEHNAASPDVVEFRLESGSAVTWWKQVGLVGGGDHWKVWNENGNSWCNWPSASTANCNTNSQWTSIVTDPGSYFVFSKAKGIFAVHTEMYRLYNLADRLSGGDRVTFRWTKD
ncbi:hypothetical protein [Corallococcus exercitus]|uniref:hypothetical protein n=1 Tax=Corallococcus exercitus TaxID=2316736 RepID=UPI0035D47635